jgi:hypothetical protein
MPDSRTSDPLDFGLLQQRADCLIVGRINCLNDLTASLRL